MFLNEVSHLTSMTMEIKQVIDDRNAQTTAKPVWVSYKQKPWHILGVNWTCNICSCLEYLQYCGTRGCACRRPTEGICRLGRRIEPITPLKNQCPVLMWLRWRRYNKHRKLTQVENEDNWVLVMGKLIWRYVCPSKPISSSVERQLRQISMIISASCINYLQCSI